MASGISFPSLEPIIVPAQSSSPIANYQETSAAVNLPGRKLKGRQRIIHHLQRISSSPSLAQLGRRRATSNPYSTRGSLSCVSLASGSSFRDGHAHGNSFSSQSSACGYSTAPTSTPSTPGLENPSGERLAIRVRKGRGSSSASASPSTIPIPLDISRPVSRGVMLDTHSEMPEIIEDYFSQPVAADTSPIRPPEKKINFWGQMPHEIRLAIFSYLRPIELVRASGTSKMFYELCFDGQLWTSFDASSFYDIIPADSLSKIVVKAGPFIKNLNLRGCIQVQDYNGTDTIVKACNNLLSASLEGCRHLSRLSLESLVSNNMKLKSLNLMGLLHVNNKTMKIIAMNCPQLEVINLSWCKHMDSRGFLPLLKNCPRLADIRAGEIPGFNNLEVANAIFETNNLQRLVLSGCTDLDDAALGCMMQGKHPEIDILTNLPIVPVRRLRDLDLSRCTRLTPAGIQHLVHLVPYLTGFQLSGCTALTDAALEKLVATVPNLTHIDLEELSELTDDFLSNYLAKSPCISKLQHLSLSYCENVGDAGVLPLLKAAKQLRSLEVDNTRITDLVLAEAAQLIKARNASGAENAIFENMAGIRYGLRLICYDCQNVSWTGIREVLFRNAEITKPQEGAGSSSSTSPINSNLTSTTSSTSDLLITEGNMSSADINIPFTNASPTVYFPPQEEQPQVHPLASFREIISLKTFYGWQPTVNEHTRRVLSNDLTGARRLESKWASWMIATEEMNTGGTGMGWAGGMSIWNTGAGGVMGRRRRRRAREAGRLHAAEEEAGQNTVGQAVTGEHHTVVQGQGQGGAGGIGSRRTRARRGGECVMM